MARTDLLSCERVCIYAFGLFFYKLQRKGACLLKPGAKNPSYVAVPTQPFSYILRSRLAHLCNSHSVGIQIEWRMVFGYLESSDTGILSHLTLVSLVPLYQCLVIGNRCPESDYVVFGETLTITHMNKQKNH